MPSKIRANRNKAMKDYYNTSKGRLSHYKSRAKEKGWEFSLINEDFSNLLTSPCYCCGVEKAYGVDRIDNSKGYFSNNVLPCCKVCNFMKKDYTYDFFIAHLKKILKYTKA